MAPDLPVSGSAAPGGQVPDAVARSGCAEQIDSWAGQLALGGAPVLAAGRDGAEDRWFVRLQGVDKEVVTIWLVLRQRTLRHEAQMMPAPETDVAGTFAYLLRRNAGAGQLRFALGAEDAVYVVGEVPVHDVDADRLDQVVGASLAMVDDCYPTAMALGHASWYRHPRRRARPTEVDGPLPG